MGKDVVALGFGIPLRHPKLRKGIDGVFQVMSRVLLDALRRLGVNASFRPKNDLEVGGKKLAGLSASAEVGKCLLFHASILVDFDTSLMLDIMNTPVQKVYDKGFSCFSQRISTISSEAKRKVSIQETVLAIKESFQEGFGIQFLESELTPWERQKTAELERDRYENDQWVFSHKHPRAKMGEGLLKTPGGLLHVFLSLAGNAIDQVIITGDFFSTSEAVQRVESALKWTIAERDAILDNLGAVWEPNAIYGVDIDELADTILLAKGRCKQIRRNAA